MQAVSSWSGPEVGVAIINYNYTGPKVRVAITNCYDCYGVSGLLAVGVVPGINDTHCRYSTLCR